MTLLIFKRQPPKSFISFFYASLFTVFCFSTFGLRLAKADESFSSPAVTGKFIYLASSLSAAVDDNGVETIVAENTSNQVFVLSRQFGSTTWTSKVFSPAIYGGRGSVAVGFNSNGSAVVCWADTSVVYSAVRNSAGTWSSAAIVGSFNSTFVTFSVDCAVNASAEAVVIWQDEGAGKLKSARRDLSGNWSNSDVASIAGTASIDGRYSTTLDSLGNSLTIWIDTNGTKFSLYQSKSSRTGAWSAGQALITNWDQMAETALGSDGGTGKIFGLFTGDDFRPQDTTSDDGFLKLLSGDFSGVADAGNLTSIYTVSRFTTRNKLPLAVSGNSADTIWQDQVHSPYSSATIKGQVLGGASAGNFDIKIIGTSSSAAAIGIDSSGRAIGAAHYISRSSAPNDVAPVPQPTSVRVFRRNETGTLTINTDLINYPDVPSDPTPRLQIAAGLNSSGDKGIVTWVDRTTLDLVASEFNGVASAAPVDLCPSDPNKLAPGFCGCGVADTDANQNGTADCLHSKEFKLSIGALVLKVKALKLEKKKPQIAQQKAAIKALQSLASSATRYGTQHSREILLVKGATPVKTAISLLQTQLKVLAKYDNRTFASSKKAATLIVTKLYSALKN